MRRAAVLIVLLTGCQGTPAARQVSSHQVVYAVTGGGTQTVDVQRPYRARVIETSAGSVTSDLAWSESGTFLTVNGQVRQSAVIAPGFPGPASHLDVALPVAKQQGLVRDLGTRRTVAGVGCDEWESLQPLDGAPFAPATRASRTVSCVSAVGEVLADSWVQGGTLLRERTATSVSDEGPSLMGKGLFLGRTPTAVPPGQTTGVTRSDAATLAKALALPVPSAPEGLELDTASALLEAAADSSAVTREAAVLTYVSKEHLLVLRISRDLVAGIGRPVRGAAVPVGTATGRLQPVLAGLQLTLTGPRGLVAVITGDLPEADLLTWASSLSLS